jgi:hypothetical protein
LVEIFARQNVQVFVVDIRSADSLVKSARIEYEHGIRQAVQHLAALGHQRIAFISGPEHLKTAIQRKGEFLGCMREIGLPSSRQLPIDGDHTMAAGMRAMFNSGRSARSAFSCSLFQRHDRLRKDFEVERAFKFLRKKRLGCRIFRRRDALPFHKRRGPRQIQWLVFPAVT